MSASIYVAIPLMALLSVVQTAVLPRFPIFGLIPLLPFLVAISWGLLRGLDEGIVWAFIAGIFFDLFSIMPLGANALAFMASITAVLLLQQILPLSHFLLPALFASLATLVYIIAYLLLRIIFGFGADALVATSLLPLVFLHAALVLPLYWLIRRINYLVRPPRVEF